MRSVGTSLELNQIGHQVHYCVISSYCYIVKDKINGWRGFVVEETGFCFVFIYAQTRIFKPSGDKGEFLSD